MEAELIAALDTLSLIMQQIPYVAWLLIGGFSGIGFVLGVRGMM